MDTKKFFLTTLLASALSAQATEPVAPTNLNAEVNGVLVTLTWDWGNADTIVSSTGFEGAELPDAWQTKNTYNFVEGSNWRLFDRTGQSEDFVVNSGNVCALVMPASEYDPDNMASLHQDEWLIVRPGEGAEYLDFHYFLHPELKQNGAYPQFPDHYYVKISWDNGESWEELWDGRWDMGDDFGMQQASLFLGGTTDSNTLVAFEAVSGAEESLYYLWSIDDVVFSGTATQTAQQRRAPEWLNGGNITYRVYCDDAVVGDYIKARRFVDKSDKDGGKHQYRVMAWSEAMNEEYPASSTEVEVQTFTNPAVRNLKAEYEATGNDRYTVFASWEAPAGERQPVAYYAYLNGKSIGWVDGASELSIGQSGLYKGVYTFEIEAAYEYPSGVSERMSATTAPGTVMPPLSLKADNKSDGIYLSWTAPEGAQSYTVYLGDSLLGTTTETAYNAGGYVGGESNVYNVHAVYADGVVSPAAVCAIELDGMPYEYTSLNENFDNGHLPLHWKAEIVDPYDKIKEMYNWRFDNWFGSDFSEAFANGALEGGFASASGVASGMNRLEIHLTTPVVTFAADEVPVLDFTSAFSEPAAGPTGPAQFLLRYSTDSGQTWVDVDDLSKTPAGAYHYDLLDGTGKNVLIRWSFLARKSGIAAVDNVRLSAATVGSSATININTAANFYTLDGRSLQAEPTQPGIYLKSQKGKTSKIIIR